MSLLNTETLINLKAFFDDQLKRTIDSIGQGDSDRLIKNKVNGFLIALQDKLLEIKPKLLQQAAGLDSGESYLK